MTSAQELVRQGLPRAALPALQQQVRAQPGDARLRVFLFQLLCVLGQWQRALGQLQVCGELDSGTLSMVATYRDALQCEAVREAVFRGETTPLVFGRPADWIALLVQALQLDAQGHAGAAAELRAQAFDAAAPRSGRLNGEAFEWLADADSRLGPVLEAVLNGRYCWIPFEALQRVVVEPPTDLRDLVWAPAQLAFANGGESVALLPVRYVRTPELAEDEALLMARRTDWLPLDAGRAAPAQQFAGIGLRQFVTDARDIGLLEVRELDIDVLAPAADREVPPDPARSP